MKQESSPQLRSETSVLERLADVFESAGLSAIFTIPGSLMNLLDALAIRDSFSLYSSSHEEILGYMSIGYWEAIRRPPVLLVTRGPGLTNLVSTIACAWRDRVPLVVVTGYPAVDDHPLLQHSTGTFHTPAAREILEPITVARFRVESGSAQTINEFATQLRDLRGPVLIEVVEDDGMVDTNLSGAVPQLRKGHQRLPSALTELGLGTLDVVLIGAGVPRPRAQALIAACQATATPIVTSMKALDRVPTGTAGHLGFIGVLGMPDANRFLSVEARRVVAIGASLNEMTIAPWMDSFRSRGGTVIRFADSAGPRFVDAQFLFDLSEIPSESDPIEIDEAPLPSHPVLRRLHSITSEKTVAIEAFRRTILSSLTIREGDVVLCTPSHAPLGCALPLAIGSALADRHRPHIVVTGDGGFLFSAMALLTVRRYELPILTIVLANGEYGTVARSQRRRLGESICTDILAPDYSLLGRSCGVATQVCASDDELLPQLDQFLLQPRPTLVVVPGDTLP